MDDMPTGYLVALTVGEVLVSGVLAYLVAAGLFAGGDFLAGVARPLRYVALVFFLVELVVPVYVLVDSYRNDIDGVWVHVAVMPVVNLLGLVAYLQERERLAG